VTSRHIVAIGGGHGLAATLRAARQLTSELTAIVGVSDNGGSSGRLRRDFDLIPPGDLRMALTALCADSESGKAWSETLSYRFEGEGELAGHAVGNVLIAALWQQTGDVVEGLRRVADLVGAVGSVIPVALEPLDIEADVELGNENMVVSGQVQVATTPGRIQNIRIFPADVQPTPQALAAVASADVILLGPGSWFTSVINHLSIGELRSAIEQSPATKMLVLNLCDQAGETEGFTPADHIESLKAVAPTVRFDVVIADETLRTDQLEHAAESLAHGIHFSKLASDIDRTTHDPTRLANAMTLSLQSAAAIREGNKPWL